MASACTQKKSELTPKERDRIRTDVKATLYAYNAAIASRGLLAEFEYLDSSSQFSWFPPGFNTWLSYDSVSAILRANAPKFRSVVNNWDTLRIQLLDDDLATYSGVLISIATDTSGTTTYTRLKETGILIKRETGWKLLNGQTDILEANP